MRAFGITCCLLLSAAAASAQPGESDAEGLFRAGRAAMRAGDMELACVHFRGSLALEATTGTRLNLAICEERQGHPVRAWQQLDELRHRMEPHDPRSALVVEGLERLQAVLSRVTLQADAAAPPGTRALDAADGSALPLGRAVAFMPGPRTIIVEAPGHAARRYELQLAAGSEQTLVIIPGEAELATTLESPPSLSAESSGAAGPTLQSETAVPNAAIVKSASAPEGNLAAPGHSPSAATLAALGVGGAALVASIVSAALMLEERNVVERECTPLCSSAGLAAGGRGQTYSTVASISLIVGAAGAGLGTYLWLTEDVAAEATVRADSSQLTLTGRF